MSVIYCLSVCTVWQFKKILSLYGTVSYRYYRYVFSPVFTTRNSKYQDAIHFGSIITIIIKHFGRRVRADAQSIDCSQYQVIVKKLDWSSWWSTPSKSYVYFSVHTRPRNVRWSNSDKGSQASCLFGSSFTKEWALGYLFPPGGCATAGLAVIIFWRN